ncbi:histone acetylation protein-domain-containing protein [Lasiosphaeria hispida]|uniref:histone acetyltransferase n=1 Tax=Lasiosphaeria hispida TaxID=260671 RepID=A0AAJ0MIM9_9PEZI|nr:histone acetylation protein-domain-containing protein [Lasiosphaeria hispida]
MSSLGPSTSKRAPKSAPSSSLLDKLAAVLPQGYKFGVHHLSTPPSKTEALCSAPPNERPDKTYGESHFLAISIDSRSDATAASKRASPGADDAKDTEAPKKVLVFAIEIFIFTTAYQTTFFVSKADSTGFLQLLNLPKGAPSPVREVASIFLTYLLEHRRRKNIQSVINLFARAQDQYLFPGSVENKGKHVLNDFGLVRWWCRVLNPLLEGPKKEPWGSTKGYLIVPGLEEPQMRALMPQTAASATNWSIGHPMARISHYTAEFDWVPPRCLIPRYPDDPKSRFRDELDEEASKWKKDMGSWKSVKTLDQFWEMMAYRQECSSGRLTGFVWLVFDPKESTEVAATTPPKLTTPTTSFSAAVDTALPRPPATPPRRRVDISAYTPQSSPLKLNLGSTPSKPKTTKKKIDKKKLSGPIIPRPPKVKTEQRNYTSNRPNTTAYYHWPLEGRGDRIVDESDFKRIVELLLHLDFSTLEKGTASTRRWISEAAMGVKWGQEVTGRRIPAPSFGLSNGGAGQVTNLAGLVRMESVSQAADGSGVNVLASGLVRKKVKTEEPASSSAESAPVQGVNVLGAGLVRKKPKA